MIKRILILSKENECPYELHPEDVLVDNPQKVLRELRKKKFEAFLICSAELSISCDSLIKRISASYPLMGIAVFGNCDSVGRIAKTLVDITLSEDSDPEIIARKLQNMLETRRILAECNLVGKSPDIKSVGEMVLRVASTDLSILIVGESGTGKELIACAIHNLSKRSNENFLPVNAAALPQGTLESELFGHERGSFTGASSRHSGYFEQADKGTLFLDEVAELPIPLQAKLLRVIETGDFIRVGGTGTVHVDVRFLTATNRDLINEAFSGNFREDLYYRLSAVKIKIPPLRERPEDIPILVYKFVHQIARKSDKEISGISDMAISAMMDYHWPGNVRELRNLVENVVMLAGDRTVVSEDLESYFNEHAQSGRRLPALARERQSETSDDIRAALALIFRELHDLKSNIENISEKVEDISMPDNPNQAEKNYILNLLKDNDYDKKATARDMDVSLRTLYRRLKKYNIDL